jgi:hypothetical protein
VRWHNSLHLGCSLLVGFSASCLASRIVKWRIYSFRWVPLLQRVLASQVLVALRSPTSNKKCLTQISCFLPLKPMVFYYSIMVKSRISLLLCTRTLLGYNLHNINSTYNKYTLNNFSTFPKLHNYCQSSMTILFTLVHFFSHPLEINLYLYPSPRQPLIY